MATAPIIHLYNEIRARYGTTLVVRRSVYIDNRLFKVWYWIT